MYIYIYLWHTYIYIHTYAHITWIFLVLPTKRTQLNPVAVSTICAQNVTSKYHYYLLKVMRAFWKNGWFQVWGIKCIILAWNILSYQKARKQSTFTRVVSNRVLVPTCISAPGQRWDSFSNCHGLRNIKYLEIHDFIMVLLNKQNYWSLLEGAQARKTHYSENWWIKRVNSFSSYDLCLSSPRIDKWKFSR